MANVRRTWNELLRPLAILVCPALLGAALALAAPNPQKPDFVKELPGPWFGGSCDDVQYIASGPEFKLSREAAALEAAKLTAPAPLFPPALPEIPPPACPGVLR
jgi:hypothetical protein